MIVKTISENFRDFLEEFFDYCKANLTGYCYIPDIFQSNWDQTNWYSDGIEDTRQLVSNWHRDGSAILENKYIGLMAYPSPTEFILSNVEEEYQPRNKNAFESTSQVYKKNISFFEAVEKKVKRGEYKTFTPEVGQLVIFNSYVIHRANRDSYDKPRLLIRVSGNDLENFQFGVKE